MIPSFSVSELQSPSSVASSAYGGRVPQRWVNSATLHKDSVSDNASGVIKELQSFYQLKGNWDSYGSAKPSEQAIKEAINFVLSLDHAGEPVSYVAAGLDGEILVELRQGERSVEVYFDDEGKGSYLIFDNGNLLHEPSPFQTVYELLHAYRNVP